MPKKVIILEAGYKINQHNVPIFNWAADLDAEALEQAKCLAQLPFAFHHVSLMPDAHAGMGMPIGGVLATKGVVVPNAVGVDIGCGMLAVNTNLEASKVRSDGIMPRLIEAVYERVPVGFAHRKTPIASAAVPDGGRAKHLYDAEGANSFDCQIGTMGGGNHFIEFQRDEEDRFYFMIHSGSRGLGKKVADYHNKIAVELNHKWYSSVPKKWQLAFLPLSTNEAQEYINDMEYCLDFAEQNRQVMAEQVQEAISFIVSGSIEFNIVANIHHNYARMEHHYRSNVMVHRKGATSAGVGQIGIIPGDQGSPSYIVSGLGNEESFNSSPHGAGRVRGRREAVNSLNLVEAQKQLDDLGIIHSLKTQNDLQEAPDAYKNIEEVMEQASDLVEVVTKLYPMGVVKGKD